MKNKGFTLVELAIVLVIIGLLVGGVLQGQELIKQAQIRSVLSSLREYDTAVNTFRAKYDNAIPGDIAQAVAFGLSTNSDTTANSGNGNGDGILSDATNYSGGSYSIATITNFDGEIQNFWIHLSNAGLVKGSFATATPPAVKTTYPSLPVGTGAVAYSDRGAGNRLKYFIGLPGSFTSVATPEPDSSSLTTQDAYSIDSKLDDGAPATGIVKAIAGYSGGVFVDATPGSTFCNTTTDYNISVAAAKCMISVAGSN